MQKTYEYWKSYTLFPQRILILIFKDFYDLSYFLLVFFSSLKRTEILKIIVVIKNNLSFVVNVICLIIESFRTKWVFFSTVATPVASLSHFRPKGVTFQVKGLLTEKNSFSIINFIRLVFFVNIQLILFHKEAFKIRSN